MPNSWCRFDLHNGPTVFPTLLTRWSWTILSIGTSRVDIAPSSKPVNPVFILNVQSNGWSP